MYLVIYKAYTYINTLYQALYCKLLLNLKKDLFYNLPTNIRILKQSKHKGKYLNGHTDVCTLGTLLHDQTDWSNKQN